MQPGAFAVPLVLAAACAGSANAQTAPNPAPPPTSQPAPAPAPADELDRLAPALEPAQPTRDRTAAADAPPVDGDRPLQSKVSKVFELADVLDFSTPRDRYIFAPPGQTASRTVNRLFADARLQFAAAPGLTIGLSDRFNLISANRETTRSCNCVRNDLRESFATWTAAPSSFLDAGRINLRNGVAFGFNPTDLFRDRAVLDFDTADPSVLRENRLGSVMLRGQQVFARGSLTLAYSPKLADPSPLDAPVSRFGLHLDRTNSEDRLLAKLTLKLADDLAPELVVFRAQHRWNVGLNLTRSLGESAIAYLEWSGSRRPKLADAAYRFAVRTRTFPQSLPPPLETGRTGFSSDLATGVSYTTAFNLNLIAEYRFHQAGFSTGDWSRWFDRGAGAKGRLVSAQLWYIRGYAQEFQEPVDKHSAFFRAALDNAFVRDLSLTGLAVVNPADRSAVVQARASYSLKGGYSIAALAFSTVGPGRSEYGSAPTRTGLEFFLSYYPK